MLSPWDDYPIHQTSQPVAHPASNDPGVYERYYLGCFDQQATLHAALALTVHPNRGLVDAAFTVATLERQESLFATAPLRPDRTALEAGPIRLELVEPMRALRLVVDEVDGLGADLLLRANSAVYEEPRIVRTSGSQTIQDRTRLDQFALPEGRLRSSDSDLAVTPTSWRAARDHSWGIRAVSGGRQGERAPSSAYFMWAMLQFEDDAVQAVLKEDPDGNPYGVSAAVIPALNETDDPLERASDIRQSTVVHIDVKYRPSTRWARQARIDIGPRGGIEEHFEVRPNVTLLMQGLGYGHPSRAFGAEPEGPVHRETWDLRKLDPLAPENLHTQQIAHVERHTGRTGVGIFEHCAKGRHAPSGLSADGGAPERRLSPRA